MVEIIDAIQSVVFVYNCNECGCEWETNGDRPKCPECRSEDYE